MSTIAELIERAHENAVEKGFWTFETPSMKSYVADFGSGDIQNAVVAKKLALISTEIAEFEVEAFKNPPGERDPKIILEELADIVIRVFDLCGYLGIKLPEDILTIRLFAYGYSSRFIAALYREVALAVQSHRKGRHDFQLHIEDIVRFAQDFACAHYSDVYALRRAIEIKMQKNESREYRHGAAY